MEWEGFTKEDIQLGLQLLVIKGSKGFYLIEMSKPFDRHGRLT
jgi:hypothetical protein